MGRYWKSLAIVVVTVITITTFYIQGSLAASDYPEIDLQKITGDEKALEPVKLRGAFFLKGASGALPSYTYHSGETTYQSELSFFERMQSSFYNSDVQRLKQEYRSFMRGKNGSYTNFYENDEVLAYANVIHQSIGAGPSEMEFEIGLLDKQKDKSTAFTVAVPNRAMYNSVYIMALQKVNNELKVVTRNTLHANGDELNQRMHIYSLDISKQDITGDKIVEDVAANNQKETAYKRMITRRIQTTSDYVVFYTDRQQQYMVYNMKTEKTTPLDLPDKLKQQEIIAQRASNVYFMVTKKEKSEIVIYNIKSQKVEKSISLDFLENVSVEDGKPMQYSFANSIEVENGKIYMLDGREVPTKIIVLDAASGDVVYRGKITTREPLGKKDFMNIRDLEVESIE